MNADPLHLAHVAGLDNSQRESVRRRNDEPEVSTGNRPRPTVPRAVKLLRKVEFVDGCWLWRGGVTKKEYGAFSMPPIGGGRSQKMMAHRASYEEFVGPIPDGLVMDHLCRNKLCINPAHLEPVTLHENSSRAGRRSGEVRAVTHCPQGHEYTPQTLLRFRSGRVCLICKDAARRRVEEHGEQQRAPDREKRTGQPGSPRATIQLARTRQDLIAALRKLGPSTAKELRYELNVSDGHVYLGLDALEHDGVVTKAWTIKPPPGKSGRKGTLLFVLVDAPECEPLARGGEGDAGRMHSSKQVRG